MKKINSLSYFRKKKGLTQSDLADLVSVAQSSLARYENGTMRPTLEVVKKIANVLEVSVDELLNDFVGERPKITLSYDWEKFEKGDVDMTGKGYDIFLGGDGMIGFKGSMLLKSKEAIEDCLAVMREQLTVAYEAQERRGVLQEAF